MQVIFVKPLNNECTLLIKVTIIPFPTMVIFFFLKSNLKNALYWGNHNGDVYFPHAYLLVSDVLLHSLPLLTNFYSFFTFSINPNYGAGEDFGESHGKQGYQSSQS